MTHALKEWRLLVCYSELVYMRIKNSALFFRGFIQNQSKIPELYLLSCSQQRY